MSSKTIAIEHQKIATNPLFAHEAESEHTPYEVEKRFYDCIRRGDVEGVLALEREFLTKVLVVGRMSNNPLRQCEYFAVSCITLATRSAIEGGLDQKEAYRLSDKYIRHVDVLGNQDGIVEYLAQKAVELATLVKKSSARVAYPLPVRRAIRFIDENLHQKINVKIVAAACKVTPSYLTRQFVQNLGDTPSHYILKRKLDASIEVLQQGAKYSDIGYLFGFCSQSHYIECFKKEFGVTPKKFLENGVIV